MDWLKSWLAWFSDLYQLVRCAVINAICWVQRWAFGLGEDYIVDPLLDVLPEPPDWDLSYLGQFYATANLFAPVDEAITYGTTLLAFWCLVNAMRFLLKRAGFLLGVGT